MFCAALRYPDKMKVNMTERMQAETIWVWERRDFAIGTLLQFLMFFFLTEKVSN